MALTLAEANRVVQGALDKAKELNIRISAAVCDAGGRLIAFNRMDGAIWASGYGSQGKARRRRLRRRRWAPHSRTRTARAPAARSSGTPGRSVPSGSTRRRWW